MSSVAQRLAVPGGTALGAVVRDGAYRRLWVSGFCLNTARWMDMVLLGWLALQLTGSPFMVGLAAFARSAPTMLLGPFAGVVADRVHRGRVLLLTQGLGLAAAAALAAVFASGRGAYWPLLALTALFGIVWALDFPARRTALYALVGPGRTATAVSLETVSMQLGKIIGPVAAGIGLAKLSPGHCYAAVAACYAIGLAVTFALRSRIATPRPSAPSPVVATLGAGIRAAWEEPTIRAVLAITILMNVLVFPYQPMLAVFARQVLNAGPEWLGALVAADGLGSLVGALVIASRRGFLPYRRVFAGAVIVVPVLLALLAGARWPWACVGILLLMGAVESGFATMQSTLVLLSAPENRRGGAMGILSACIGTGPIGALALGLVAGGIGVAWAMAINGAVALAGIAPLARGLWRRPPPPAGDLGR